MTAPVHFWVPDAPAGVESWCPDREPGRFASGVGHGVLELWARLRARGWPVTLGPDAPAGVPVVAHLESVWDWGSSRPDDTALLALLEAVRDATTVTVVRGDVPLSFLPSLPGAVQVVPAAGLVRRADQRWLPLLPQRGMARRLSGRHGQVRTVGLHAYAFNVPAELRDPDFGRRLRAQGRDLVLRTWDGTQGHPAWHDFSDMDAVLCLRSAPLAGDLRRKPATKLVNAWCAGAVPVVSTAEAALVELVRPDVDALLVDSAAEVPDVLRRLDDLDLVARLEQGGAERAVEFAPDAVLDRWAALVARPGTARAGARAAHVLLRVHVRSRRAARRWRQRLPRTQR